MPRRPSVQLQLAPHTLDYLKGDLMVRGSGHPCEGKEKEKKKKKKNTNHCSG